MAWGATSPVVVGRELEIQRLDEALAVAAEDGSAVLLISGEAGVGKTRLVDELATRAAGRGFCVCVGRCVDLGEAIWPLAPLRDIVASLVDELDDEALDLVLGGARDVLASLVPELGSDRAGEAPVSSDRMCELVVGMFRRLAQRAPVLLVIEDLHWADATTRTLFSALAQVSRLQSLLLVGTFRSDELHRRHPLRPALAEVERRRECERIEVRPLERAATVELIAAIGGVPADRVYADDVHRQSAGNPFFVEELVAARASGVTGLPDTLRDVILARAAQLDDAAVDVLGVAAAAGPTVPEVLTDVCGVEETALRETLDRLFATALVVPDRDEVRFRHELGREVLYEMLLPGRRARVHAALARSVERRRPERLGEIARHWCAAHDGPRALAASVAAGRQALREGAAAEAEGHLGRALELWDTVDEPSAVAGLDHPALLVETATAAEHARHLEAAIELDLRAVAELAGVDPLREAEVWLQLRDVYRFMNRWDDCAVTVARALALLPESPPSSARAEALANAALGEVVANRANEAEAYARQAIAVAEAVGDGDMVVKAYDTLVAALQLAGDPDGALAVAVANLARCGPSNSPERTISVYNAVTGALTGVARYDEIAAHAERAVELARNTGLGGPRAGWIAERWVESLVVLGRWTEAERLVRDLTDLLDHPDQEGDLADSWGVALIRQGRVDEARPLIEQAQAALARGHLSEAVPWEAAAVAMFVAAEGGDVEPIVDDVVARAEYSVGGNSLLVATAIAALADAGPAQRHTATNERTIATATRWIAWMESVEHAGRRPTIEQRLHRDHARAQLQRLNGSLDPQPWSQLVAGWERIGFRYEAAYARLRHAEALLAGTAGRSTAARRAATDVLVVARAVAAELGAAPLLTEIGDLARRARLAIEGTESTDPRRPVIRAVVGLTSREHEVLALLALGRSNGQIAKELYISTKTASVHVSNILRKLDVANRVEAAAVATAAEHPAAGSRSGSPRGPSDGHAGRPAPRPAR
jgi:DNA-binding CsgD family transcriptional regulator/tetratricopeptide (TPR) repeat protein